MWLLENYTSASHSISNGQRSIEEACDMTGK